MRRSPLDQIALRQRCKAFRKFAKPRAIIGVDNDSNARIQLFVFVDSDLGAHRFAEQTLDFERDLLFDGKVPQCRLEDFTDRGDRQPLQDDDAFGLRRRLHDVAFQMDLQAAQIDRLVRVQAPRKELAPLRHIDRACRRLN